MFHVYQLYISQIQFWTILELVNILFGDAKKGGTHGTHGTQRSKSMIVNVKVCTKFSFETGTQTNVYQFAQ